MLMRNMFTPKPCLSTPGPASSSVISDLPEPTNEPALSIYELVDHPSDNSSSDDDSGSDADDEDDDIPSSSSRRTPAVPPLKRRKLDIPIQKLRAQKREARLVSLQKALDDIKKLINSKKTEFVSGATGLQSYCARAIQSYLVMVVKRGRLEIDASEKAAESNGFAAKWGGRCVRSWTRRWIKERKLPESRKGRHAKVYSLLDDPAIKAEL